MMTVKQYYLLKLMEECAEVAQIASKQMQFGGDSTGLGMYDTTNRRRLRDEINDLLGVVDKLMDLREISEISPQELLKAKLAKQSKMLHWLRRAQTLKFVEEDRIGIIVPGEEDKGPQTWRDQADGISSESERLICRDTPYWD